MFLGHSTLQATLLQDIMDYNGRHTKQTHSQVLVDFVGDGTTQKVTKGFEHREYKGMETEVRKSKLKLQSENLRLVVSQQNL